MVAGLCKLLDIKRDLVPVGTLLGNDLINCVGLKEYRVHNTVPGALVLFTII